MWPAKARAQSSTRPSPRGSESAPAPDSRNSPSTDTPAADHASADIRSARNSAPSNGVNTTIIPVMNPALEAVVSSRPSVWNT